jgi:hypothetical protein
MDMDALAFLLIAIIAIMVFDVLAVRFGVDSRESIDDDHARRVGFPT